MSNLPPAASRGPGRILLPDAKREVEFARRVQGAVSEGALQRQEDKLRHPKRYAGQAERVFATFRDGHNVLRDRLGRFAKETAPKQKRPKRIPWDKKEK